MAVAYIMYCTINHSNDFEIEYRGPEAVRSITCSVFVSLLTERYLSFIFSFHSYLKAILTLTFFYSIHSYISVDTASSISILLAW